MAGRALPAILGPVGQERDQDAADEVIVVVTVSDRYWTRGISTDQWFTVMGLPPPPFDPRPQIGRFRASDDTPQP